MTCRNYDAAVSEFLNITGNWLAYYAPLIATFLGAAGIYLTGRYFGSKTANRRTQHTDYLWAEHKKTKTRRTKNNRQHPRYGHNAIKTAPGPRDWAPPLQD